MTKRLFYFVLVLFLVFGITSHSFAKTRTTHPQQELKTSPSQQPASEPYKTNTQGLDARNFDPKISPCTDFFQYANGSWLKRNPIPAEYSAWSLLHELDQRNELILKGIAEELATSSKTKPHTNEQMIGDFYAVAMDTEKSENLGLIPLDVWFSEIESLITSGDVQKLVGHWHKDGLEALFDLVADGDFKNSRQAIAYAGQGGLGLPDRDYYLKTDADAENIRKAYLLHLERMFLLLGNSDAIATEKALQVMQIETELAQTSLTRVELRDPEKLYNPLTIAEANALTPHFDWQAYFSALHINPKQKFSLAPVAFFKSVDHLFSTVSIDAWKAYFQWHLLKQTSPYLSQEFVQAHFDFYGTTLVGTKTMRPRWKRVLSAVDENLGEVMGQLFIKKQFPPAAKKTALSLIQNLLLTAKTRLNNNTWMQDETKAMALKKLSTIMVKIGYPDKWKDFKNLQINRSSYVGNVLRARAFAKKDELRQIGKPIDRKQWGMNPQEVNAYYNPILNEIVFPAGILQPPLFDFHADAAVNYGGIGAVIGHEITHGFDDEGSQFDAKGNLKNWWTETDRKEFEKRTQVLVEQYNRYQPIPGLFVNGKLTLGENIGDFSGVTLALAALKQSDAPKEKIDGLTFEQRFFLAWAQTWRYNSRPESMRLLVKTNPHSPPQYRVNGVIKNIPEFQSAFSCPNTAPMSLPEKKRADIW